MTAVVSQTGQGGWPMTVFLLPDGRPFYGGTYFPPEARGGLPAFRQVLDGIATAYRERRDVVERQAGELAESLQEGRLGTPPAGFVLSQATLLDALLTLRGQHDERNGGFGRAPKFPPHSVLTFLLRMHRRSGSEEALAMALRTLKRMADGGIHDQLGGGFHRYAVDAIWLVPHFEQMLYDNALLARAYLAAWQVTGDEQWREVAEGILDYLLRELALEHGGFASAQDADTDGVEGATFTWTPAQLRAALSPEDAELAERTWGVTADGNFEGATVLSLVAPPEDDAGRAAARAHQARSCSRRAPPARSRRSTTRRSPAGTAWPSPRWPRARDSAGEPTCWRRPSRCAAFLLGPLSRPDGGLWRTHRAGRSQVPGFLDDYAQVGHSACTSSTWRRASTATSPSRTGSRCSRASASAPRTARSSTPRTMRRCSWPARASWTTTRRRRAARRSPACSCGWRAPTASPSWSAAPRRSSTQVGHAAGARAAGLRSPAGRLRRAARRAARGRRDRRAGRRRRRPSWPRPCSLRTSRISQSRSATAATTWAWRCSPGAVWWTDGRRSTSAADSSALRRRRTLTWCAQPCLTRIKPDSKGCST